MLYNIGPGVIFNVYDFQRSLKVIKNRIIEYTYMIFYISILCK